MIALAPVDEFIAAVREDLAPDQITESELERYEVDGEVPSVAVEPSTIEELQVVLSEAHEARLAVVPVGGMQQMGAGNAPDGFDVAVSLARLDRIIAHEAADMTVTVQAGVRLSGLQRLLAEAGQHLPLDPPGGDEATIGGMLAADASGPLRHAFGTVRDWLIGIRVVHADGTTSKAGGRVVKNVTGYDMPKLYVGSLGTIGVIAEATFRVAPLPRSTSTVALSADSARAACALATAAHDAGLALHAAELLSPPGAYAVLGESRWVLLLRAAGSPAAVERTLRDVHALAEGQGAPFAIRDSEQTWTSWRRSFAPRDLSLRISVLPTRVVDAVEVLDRGFAGAAAMISATTSAGLVRARLEPTRAARASALVERAREVAERHDGYAVIEAAPPALKRQTDAFGRIRPDFAIMRRLKEQFDPQRTLAPGRYVGRL
jgi:glycolate oxidase FAD binding subunit